ncbi:hypothetical protein QGP82_09035 [Leptothoe sp. LEGE 181152]|nr:hypothetical protein [Leptothoe sp. LEGE 181152]
MDIEISLYRRQIQLSVSEQSIVQAASSRKAMRDHFQTRLANKATAYSSIGTLQISPSTLKVMVRKYSEQLVYKPLEELGFWFGYYSGIFLEPGYPSLYYSRRTSKQNLSPNKSAVAAIGEGIAGLVMQRSYRARKLARPIQDYPDIVMVADRKTYLVEAKATTKSVEAVQQVLEAELVRISVYSSACEALDVSNTVRGILIGTALTANNFYQTYITEVLV